MQILRVELQKTKHNNFNYFTLTGKIQLHVHIFIGGRTDTSTPNHNMGLNYTIEVRASHLYSLVI